MSRSYKVTPPQQGLEIGEKLLWNNEETRLLGLTHLIQCRYTDIISIDEDSANEKQRKHVLGGIVLLRMSITSITGLEKQNKTIVIIVCWIIYFLLLIHGKLSTPM